MAYKKSFKVVAQDTTAGTLTVNFNASMVTTVQYPMDANGVKLTGSDLLSALVKSVTKARLEVENPARSITFDETLDNQLGIGYDMDTEG